MESAEMDSPPGSMRHKRSPRWKYALVLASLLFAGYFVVAYVVAPLDWVHYIHKHPSFDDIPNITETKIGIHGDPLNVALIGTEVELKSIMIAAKWYPADPLTLKSCLEIAEATVLRRPYKDAPVSNLFWEGRKEDLAFESPVVMTPANGITSGSGDPRKWTRTAVQYGWELRRMTKR